MVSQGLAVAFRAVALMGCQPVGRPAPVKPFHQAVPGLLGHDACRSDGHIQLITPHKTGLGPRPEPEGQHAVDPHERWGLRQPLQRSQHGQLGGRANSVGIDLTGRGLPQAPPLDTGHDEGQQMLATAARELLAVGDSKGSQTGRGSAVEKNGSREDRTEQTAPTHLINPGPDSLRAHDLSWPMSGDGGGGRDRCPQVPVPARVPARVPGSQRQPLQRSRPPRWARVRPGDQRSQGV